MSLNGKIQISEIIKTHKTELLSSWLQEQLAAGIRSDLIKETHLASPHRDKLWFGQFEDECH